jgi:signal transduction histidine kinase
LFFYGVPGALYPAFLLWWLALSCYIHALLFKTMRRAAPEMKNRLRYCAISTAIGYIGGSLCFLPVFGINLYPWTNYAVFIYPFVMAYAIVRHQLADITVVIRKTVIYSIVTAILTAIYACLLALITRVIQNAYASAISAAIIALLFHPLGIRIQRWIDRYFPTERLDKDLLRETAGNFAHEIKRPLAKISLPAELMLSDLQDVKMGTKSFEDVYPQMTDRLRGIIEQAMDAGNVIEAIRELATPNTSSVEPVDLRCCIEDIFRLEANFLQKHRTEVKIYWPKEFPKVLAREQHVRIIFSNLIRNAVEAMDTLPTTAAHQIEITVAQNDPWLDMTMTDTGPGIPADIQTKLFQPHITTKGKKGTGLGLYLSYHLAESCHGNLEVIRTNGAGACFRLRLPAVKN